MSEFPDPAVIVVTYT